MLRRNKRHYHHQPGHRSNNKNNNNNNSNYAATLSSRYNNLSHEAMHVKNFMQSIDPSRNKNVGTSNGNNNTRSHSMIPLEDEISIGTFVTASSSSSKKMTTTTTTTNLSSLPFLPPQESYDMEPPLRTPPSLHRKRKNKPAWMMNSSSSSPSRHSSAATLSSSAPSVSSSSASMMSSLLLPSSGIFHSSNRSRIKTNPIKKIVPYPRKNLFLSPTRAMANNNNNNKYTNHRIDIGSNAEFVSSSDHLFEADPPVIGRNYSHLFFDSPTTIESKIDTTGTTMKTPHILSTPATPQQRKFGAPSAADAAIVTDPWHSTPTAAAVTTTTILPPAAHAPRPRSTPKRVSLDTGRNSPLTLPPLPTSTPSSDDSIGRATTMTAPTIPVLNPQPSVGTAMAASVLVSLMVIPEEPPPSLCRPHAANKRNIGVCSDNTSPLPTMKKFKLQTPNHKISNGGSGGDGTTPAASVASHQDCVSTTPCVSEEENGENCNSLSNRASGHSLFFSTPKTPLPAISHGRNRFATTATTATTTTTKTKSLVSENHRSVSPSLSTNVVLKRIPRRFIDDPGLPVLKSGMRLSAPNDPDELNSLHCFVRSELLEVFVIQDSETPRSSAATCRHPSGSSNPTKHSSHSSSPQQTRCRVGIRCVHCGTKPKHERTGSSMSTFFPKSLQDIYRGVCTWQRIHFQACKHIPGHLKETYKNLKQADRSRGKKAHWVQSAHRMGLRNVDENRNGVVWMGSVGAVAASAAAAFVERKPEVALDLTILDESTTDANEKTHSGGVCDAIVQV